MSVRFAPKTSQAGSSKSGPRNSVVTGVNNAVSDAGGVVIVGTASGKLHCITCATGKQLWEVQTGQGISTAAAFCPATPQPDCPISFGHAHPGAAAAASDDSSRQLPLAESRQTSKPAMADSVCPTDMHLLPQTDKLPLEPKSTKFHNFSSSLISCTNQGAVRVLKLPAEACCSSALSEEVSQAGQQAATGAAEEARQQCVPTISAAVQMPGTHPSACC